MKEHVGGKREKKSKTSWQISVGEKSSCIWLSSLLPWRSSTNKATKNDVFFSFFLFWNRRIKFPHEKKKKYMEKELWNKKKYFMHIPTIQQEQKKLFYTESKKKNGMNLPIQWLEASNVEVFPFSLCSNNENWFEYIVLFLIYTLFFFLFRSLIYFLSKQKKKNKQITNYWFVNSENESRNRNSWKSK